MRKKNKGGRPQSNYVARFASALAEPEVSYQNDIDLFDQTIENIGEALESGEIDEAEAEELEASAIVELRQRLGGFVGIDDDDENNDDDDDDDGDDGAEYAYGTDLATFSAGSLFGNAVLELGATDGYETVEDVAVSLMEGCGINEESAIGLITGALLPTDFEDPEGLIDAVAGVFGASSQDEDVYDQLMDVGLTEGEAEEVDPEQVQYSRQLVSQDRQIRNLTAEFTQLQVEQVLRDEIAELERDAQAGVEEGWLPPAAFSMLFGDEDTESGRIAAFSQVCAANSVDEATEIYAMRKQLELMRRLGPLVQFGMMVEEPLTEGEIQHRTIQDRAARAYAKSMRSVLDMPE